MPPPRMLAWAQRHINAPPGQLLVVTTRNEGSAPNVGVMTYPGASISSCINLTLRILERYVKYGHIFDITSTKLKPRRSPVDIEPYRLRPADYYHGTADASASRAIPHVGTLASTLNTDQKEQRDGDRGGLRRLS